MPPYNYTQNKMICVVLNKFMSSSMHLIMDANNVRLLDQKQNMPFFSISFFKCPTSLTYFKSTLFQQTQHGLHLSFHRPRVR